MSYFKLGMTFFFLVVLAGRQGYSQSSNGHHISIIHTRIVVLNYRHNDSSSLKDHADTLRLPVPADKYPELKKALSFENIADSEGEQAVKKQYASCSCGITGLSYEVMFESKDVISLKIFSEGMGAYPSSSWQWLTLNTHTGKPYAISNEVSKAGLKWIYDSYKALMKKRIAGDQKTNRAPKGESQEDYDSIYKQVKESIDSLGTNEMLKSYVFTDSGIGFTTEGILPHATQALEPNRDWLVPYKKLHPFKAKTAVVLK